VAGFSFRRIWGGGTMDILGMLAGYFIIMFGLVLFLFLNTDRNEE